MSSFFSVTPLLPVTACLMIGIVAGSWWVLELPLPFVLLAAVVVAFACRRWPLVQTMAILVCCVVLGMTLVQINNTDNEEIYDCELHSVVMSEPAERPKTIGVDLLIPATGRTVRCYLWKDERSIELNLGDGVVVRFRSEAAKEPFLFVRSSEWYTGGTGLNQLSRWQLSRLWFLMQRHRLLQRYHELNAGEDTYAVLAAMTLGDKSTQTHELRETYAVSGASHILAISGLHVGIVYMLLTWLMLGRRRFWLTQTITVAAIWAFALLTGLSPSVTRAATMITIYAVFAQRGGRTSSVNVLCFAAIVMLLVNPQTLFDIGFQLSFGAVFAILTLMPMIQKIYQPRNMLLRWTWDMVMLSTCAQVGTAPLIAYYFGRFSTYFLLTNLLVIPAATLILYGALVALLFPPASVALLWIVRTMNDCLRFIASLPGASIEGLRPTATQVALVYVLFVIGGFLLNIIKNYVPFKEKAVPLQGLSK